MRGGEGRRERNEIRRRGEAEARVRRSGDGGVRGAGDRRGHTCRRDPGGRGGGGATCDLRDRRDEI